MTAKTLRTGSVGERAVAFVKASPTLVNAAMLADELDISIGEVAMQLAYIVKMGFLELTRGQSRAEDIYALGATARITLDVDAAPDEEAETAVEEAPAAPPPAAPVGQRLSVVPPVFLGVDPAEPGGDRTVHSIISFADPEPPDVVMAVISVDALSIALFDDGRLLLEVNGSTLLFPPPRVAQLVNFLDGFDLPRG